MKLLEQNHVRYGLILTFVVVVCLFLMEVTGQNESFDQKSPLTLFYMMIAPAIVWFFGIKAKKKELKGKLTYKQGLREGFKMSLVYGITSPFVFLAYYIFVNPEILDYVRAAYSLTNASDTVVILVDMFAQFLAAIVFGTIYGAVISFFVKNKAS